MKTKAIKKGFARLICAVLAFSLAASVMLPTAYADSEADTADVTIDGEKADVKTGGDWVSYDIQGSDEPTAAAPAGSFFGPAKGVNIQNLGVKNLYTLTVSTGINNGSCVEYFAVRYKDNDNVAQTKYLFPRTHALKATYDFIREAAGGKIGDNTISGLSAIGDLSTAYDSKTRILSNLGYQRKTPDDLIALRAMSVDEYLFMADNGISEVTGIEAFMSKGQWTVQGMSVSHVTEIGGYNEYGFYSGRYFLSLGKQKIAELSKKSSGVMTLTATGDTLINVGGKSSSYYDLKTVNKTIDCPTGDLYTFRIDITDKIDSGLESLIRNNSADSDPASGKVVEDLALEVQYIDKNGWTRIVTMPVLLSVIGQNKLLGDKVATIGLGQRGDTLAFTGYLPEYQSLATTRLYVGSAARSRLEVTGGINTPEGRKLLDEQATVKQRIDQGNINVSEEKYMKPFRDAYATRMAPATALEEDYLSVSGVSLFKGTCRMTNTPAGTDTVTNQSVPSLTLAYAYESQYPLYYFTTTVETGFRINPGTSDTFDMRTYVSGDPIVATGMKGDLLVRLKTGDSYGSGTTGNILFTMTYMDHQGRTATTRRYDVKQEVNDYLGYWPSAEGINGDYAYLYGASASNYLEFPVTVSDIAAVISVDISLDGYSTDEWVLEGIAVYVLDDIGRRQVYAQDSELGTDNEGSDRSTYRIVRPTKKTLLEPFPFTLDKLVTPGDHVPLDIGKGTVTPYQEVDFNSMRYSMTHEQTMLDLGFVNRKKIYDIDVKVAGDTAVLTENGDSGSNNRFYFQLEFRNGTTSAYVLANQQLGSDGFRSGYSERFSICVNRDYSDVSKIRIIPEDVSEDSEIFDKLNIEQISITERAYGGSSTQWVVDQVGWIGIDYRDSAELNAIKQDKGRSAGLIAKEYRVSYQRNVTNLLCEVLTLPWDTDYQQVQGSISCDLEYIDTNGQPQTTSFDVVRAMAEYMKKTPITYETYENGSFDNSYTNLGSVSDPKWMLRPNHCDRFMLPPLANVKSLKSMTFHATSRNNKPAKWVIGDVSISRVLIDDDSVELTKMGEYYRSMQTEPYCSAVSDKANNTLLLPAGMTETLTLELSDNEVTWAEDKSWAASVTSLPDTMNDTMNIYIYPDPDMPDIEGAVVKVAAMYTVPFSKMEQKREAAMRTYGSGTKDAVFYAEGIKADGMKNLNLLGLQCRDASIIFDHALVQQVRDGVVVANYQVDFHKTSAVFGLEGTPENSVTINDNRTQKLMISLDQKTTPMSLFAQNHSNDIAVALKYKSTLDQGRADFYSPYIYLTEAGINKVYPGQMLEIPFDIPFVREITGYEIVGYGNLDVRVAGAYAANYSYTDKDEDGAYTELTMLNKCCFNKNYLVTNAISEYTVSSTQFSGANSVAPLELEFTTAQAQEGFESGTDAPVEMTINYTDHQNASKTLEISDLRQYIQDSERFFRTGTTKKVALLLPECQKVDSITLLPKDPATGMAHWTLEKIEGSLGMGETLFTRVVDRTINENDGAANISLKDIKMTTSITTPAGDFSVVTNHLKEISLTGGTSVDVTVRLDGSEDINAKAYWQVNGTNTDETEKRITQLMPYGRFASFTFTVPENTSSVPLTYMLEVSSAENDMVKDIIKITVPVPEKAAESTTTTTTTTVPAAESIAPESITNETYADQSGAAAAELPDVDDVPLEEPHTEVVDAADNGTSQEKSEFENSNTEKTDSNSEG